MMQINNHAQQELLESLIGEEGIYFETIKDNEYFNRGTKILYLSRAIEQNCQTFLQSLDKLYDPSLSGAAKTSTIEFIRSLKVINDLCFNNEVKYDIHGTRKALTHYFGALGNIENEADFQSVVQDTIAARINELRAGHEEAADSERSTRIDVENNISAHTEWRQKLDLPLNQLPPNHRLFGESVTVEQYQQLSAEVRTVIEDDLSRTRRFIQMFGVTFDQIQALSAQELTEFLNTGLVRNLARLVNEARIPLADLIALDQAMRTELLNYSTAVAYLVNEGHIPLADLIALDQAMRTQLLNNSFDVAQLVNEGHIPLTDLIALDQAMRTQLLSRGLAVARLVNEGHIPLADLIALDPAMRTEVLNNATAVAELVNKGHIPWADLIALDPAMRTEVLNQPYDVDRLMKGGHIKLPDLVALDPAMRTELLNWSVAVAKLVNKGHISLADLIALDQARRDVFFKYIYEVLQLVKENSFEKLLGLSVAQLRTIIDDPDSEASREILNPPTSSFRPGMF